MDIDRKLRQDIELRMRQERIGKGELARRLGMSAQYLSDVMTGRRGKLPRSLTRILEELELELTLRPRRPADSSALDLELEGLIAAVGPLEALEPEPGRGKPKGSRVDLPKGESLSDAVVAERDERTRGL